MTGTLTNIYRAGLLCSLLISNIAETSSMTLGLTEMKNKVSKIKVNQRGKLWASGHFMGKKSAMDGSLMESGFEDVNVPAEFKAVLLPVKDLQTRLTHKLPSKYKGRDDPA